MDFIKWRVIFVLAPLLFVLGCSNGLENGQIVWNDPQELQGFLLERNSSVVMDEFGNSVPSATVAIGNQVVTTDQNGVFKLPTNWTEELPVTISKDGYVKTTYLKQLPKNQIFEVKLRKSTVRHEVKGSVTGFGNLPSDGFIDFALSITSLEPQNALNFDIAQLISEENDIISVMGQELAIPTNVFLPKQKESYSFIPVTVEKAFYRLFYDFQGTYKVQTNRGKFDFKKVSEKLKSGKSFFEVVNDFEFLSLGTGVAVVNQQNVTLNLDGSQRKLSPKIAFQNQLPKEGMLFGIAMSEEDGKLLPSDIKLKENKNQLLALPDGAQKSSVLLVHAEKEQVNKDVAKLSSSMSTALVDSTVAAQGFVLDRISAPEITNTGMKLSKPNLKGNLKGFATYAALSDVKVDEFKRFNVERADITWEIYSPGWIDTIDLPEVNAVRASQQWHVVFYGIDSANNKQFNGPKTLNQATHAVHNAVKF